MQLIENLKWRYATKKFDASKKVSELEINSIKEAVQLAASSYGLQPFKVLEIKSHSLKELLKPLSWNQSQITDASHLFVFCNIVELTNQDVDDLMQLKSEINNIPTDKIKGYGDFIKGKLKEKSKEEMFHWTAKQTYIALANAITACAELRIDCTPIEGFEPEAYNQLLKLNEKGLNACALLAVGYRHAEDLAQNSKKVRKPMESIFELI
ncbi:MAG: NAD(P)H-dependent oxidoreductase [Bacteroidetes bacterium]|nr:MAG: NAD(P)H-dependent oxidoreductase [Bacteroidota bacterium]MBL1144471.1 NAD(P)H-dependent oxidoreductase [Bacteroidota bacterium]MCB0803754.1 NAD(P)H-dependent oxidoreductase [Flavobacteriales bacterium]NOG57266.1 NAD(P)H-dependent oxidoreductase [Bacteroidota bacterium]